ncbi:MAG: hypothetical protein JJT90_03035 [Ectothiorhodospiraceae bacterium]|nr:hypothetical protein [Ectothiorhodospiraceae bacterium]
MIQSPRWVFVFNRRPVLVGAGGLTPPLPCRHCWYSSPPVPMAGAGADARTGSGKRFLSDYCDTETLLVNVDIVSFLRDALSLKPDVGEQGTAAEQIVPVRRH